jgi:glycosyltransferase involved in cell wall biosynthesis
MLTNICSPSFDPADSYGRLARELSAGLMARGWSINHLGQDAPQHLIKPVTGGLMLGYPTDYQHFGAMPNLGRKIAITMFESTELPPGWADSLNAGAAVIVPAPFLVDIFRASGVTVPIEVVPLGISAAFAAARQRPDDGPFTFLAIADRGRRKGWHKAVLAFDKAFGHDLNYRLILKARSFPLRLDNANIAVIAEDYTDEQMADLYRRCQAMVFPSSGEGFGLPPREFAATGGVALATDWGGTSADISQWGVAIPVGDMVDAWPERADWHGQLGQWADIDVDTLANLMQFVTDNYAYYRAFAVNAGAFARMTYTWGRFVSGALNVLEQGNGNSSNSN